MSKFEGKYKEIIFTFHESIYFTEKFISIHILQNNSNLIFLQIKFTALSSTL